MTRPRARRARTSRSTCRNRPGFSDSRESRPNNAEAPANSTGCSDETSVDLQAAHVGLQQPRFTGDVQLAHRLFTGFADPLGLVVADHDSEQRRPGAGPAGCGRAALDERVDEPLT